MEDGVQVLKDDSTSHCMAARDTGKIERVKEELLSEKLTAWNTRKCIFNIMCAIF